jgi:hypothetical protein
MNEQYHLQGSWRGSIVLIVSLPKYFFNETSVILLYDFFYDVVNLRHEDSRAYDCSVFAIFLRSAGWC